MLVFEILVYVVVGYVLLLLLLEGVIWKLQPDMEGGVTLHIDTEGKTIKRTLYGLEYDDRLYVSSNHWFRTWYHAILGNPQIGVERDGEIQPYIAVPIEGDEQLKVAKQYDMGFALRLLCGFAPQRFLRLDPQPPTEVA